MKLPAMLAGTTAGLLLVGLAVAQSASPPPPHPSAHVAMRQEVQLAGRAA